MTTKHITPPVNPLEYQAWLDGIVSVREGAELRGVSTDNLKKNERERLLKLSDRRLGIRRRDALMLD